MGQKVADRPHTWTLALSAAAVLISLATAVLSVRNASVAREALSVSKAANASFVRVVGARVRAFSDHTVELAVSVSNLGRSPAGHISIGFKAVPMLRGGNFNDGDPTKGFDIGELAPGESRVVSIRAEGVFLGPMTSLLPASKQWNLILFSGRFNYADSVTGQTRTGTVCFEHEKGQALGADLATCEGFRERTVKPDFSRPE